MAHPMTTLAGAAMVALGVGSATTVWAQDSQPQDNRCWGKIASQLAQSVDDDGDGFDVTGGGMGAHSRSATAAEINGGFATNPLVPITQPRQGVGNVSKGPPHNTDPGDGGNGVHAMNNGGFAVALDPVDGQGGGEALTCVP